MKRWLPLLLLCPLVFAQVKVAGPSKIAGSQKVVPGGGVDNQIGPVDALVDMNCGNIGVVIAVINLNCGTIGLSNTGGWAVSGTLTGFTIAARQASCDLLGSAQIDGQIYPIEHTSQAMAFDHANTVKTAQLSVAGTTFYRIAVVSGCLILGPPSVAQGSAGLFDYLVIKDDAGGHYAAMQLNNGNCGGAALYALNIESDVSGTQHSPCTSALTQNQVIRYSLKADFSTGNSSLMIFDTSGVQIGSTVTRTITTGGNAASVWLGQNEVGTAAGTTSYFQNTLVRYSGVVPYPIGPVSTTQDPVYWVGQSHNFHGSGTQTTLATTKVVDEHAGDAVVVTCSNENASGQTTSVTNTAGETFTSAASVKSAANAQSISQWVTFPSIARPAQLYTCNWPASQFDNIDVQIIHGATSFDTGAVGNTASGANITSGSFTPSTSTGANVACAYLQAGQANTAGSNYNLLNTSATNSMGCQMRNNAPNSSQTASMTHANTAASMIAVGNYKQ